MKEPTLPRFVIAALVAAICAVTWRVLVSLVANQSLDWAHLEHLLFDSSLLPFFLVTASATFLLIGAPVFLWARRNGKLSWPLFAVIGGFIGYLASYPSLLVPIWASVYASSGIVGALVLYAMLTMGTRRVQL